MKYMKEDLKIFQNQNTKTECSISRLMVVATTIHYLEGKFFADEWDFLMALAALKQTLTTVFLALFNKSGYDLKIDQSQKVWCWKFIYQIVSFFKAKKFVCIS